MSDPISGNPAPGWYAADVAGQQRWWDGDSWTTYSRATPVDPSAIRRYGWSTPTRSIVFGVVFAVLALNGFGLTLLTLLANPLLAIVPLALSVTLVVGSVALFLNVGKLNRYEAATTRAQSPTAETDRAGQIPPGWYGGGVAGEERWWDGAAWTAHARPVGATSTPPG